MMPRIRANGFCSFKTRGCRLAICLLVAAVLLGCRVGSGGDKMAEIRGEEWTIGGRQVRVSSTFYERSERGAIIYVVQYRGLAKTELFGLDDNRAFELARPLFAYVYQTKTYERSRFFAVRGSAPPPIWIAIDLLPPQDGEGQAYRIIVPLGELGWRLRQPARAAP